MVWAIGWIAAAVQARIVDESAQQLGLLIWLVTPLATVLLLRTFAGDGWKDFGLAPLQRGHASGYAVAASGRRDGGAAGRLRHRSGRIPRLFRAAAGGGICGRARAVIREKRVRGIRVARVPDAEGAFAGTERLRRARRRRADLGGLARFRIFCISSIRRRFTRRRV
jgi:hypothetical protein